MIRVSCKDFNMILKKNYPALERATSLEGAGAQIILHGLPDELLEGLEKFARRNALAVSESDGEKTHHCCVRCLKAHALKRAKVMKLDEKRMKWLNDMFGDEEEGHSGFYLDEEELVKI
jgi:hypothetical protein